MNRISTGLTIALALLIGLIAGYFIGREHVKREIRNIVGDAIASPAPIAEMPSVPIENAIIPLQYIHRPDPAFTSRVLGDYQVIIVSDTRSHSLKVTLLASVNSSRSDIDTVWRELERASVRIDDAIKDVLYNASARSIIDSPQTAFPQLNQKLVAAINMRIASSNRIDRVDFDTFVLTK